MSEKVSGPMNENDGTFGMMGPYEEFVVPYNDRILPLSAIRGGQGEKLSKENTMEEDKGAALSRMAEQYELVADILGDAYTYAGVLNRREIMEALVTALETLDTEFNDDFERVEDEVAQFDIVADRPGQPQKPHGGKHRASEN